MRRLRFKILLRSYQNLPTQESSITSLRPDKSISEKLYAEKKKTTETTSFSDPSIRKRQLDPLIPIIREITGNFDEDSRARVIPDVSISTACVIAVWPRARPPILEERSRKTPAGRLGKSAATSIAACKRGDRVSRRFGAMRACKFARL